MSVTEIFCQDRAISILQKAFAVDRAPHAYIFAGRDGVGKFTTAREWAGMLLCRNRSAENQFADSCGSCESCRLLEADSHPDFHYVYKELKEFTDEGRGQPPPVDLPISVIRDFIVKKVSNRPTLSQRKVFVVTEAEKLNLSSQNALLKVLEEPPGYCTIILLCTRLEKLLPTIKSRCQMIRFGPVAEDKIFDKLTETGIQDRDARYLARLAEGSLGQAWQWAQLELAGANLYQIKRELLVCLCTYKYAEALRLAEWLLQQTKKIGAVWADLDKATSRTDIHRRAQRIILQMVISALRDVMRSRLKGAEDIINFDQEEQIKALARRFGPEQAGEKIASCYQSLRQIEFSVNEKLIFEHLLLEMAPSDIMSVHV